MTQQYQLASLTSRIGSYLADFLFLILVAGILSIPVQHFQIKQEWLIFYPVIFCLMFIVDKRNNGQSLGKKYLSIKVVDIKTLSKPKFTQLLIRNILRLIPIDIFFILGKNRQRLGDKLAGTIVINVS